MHCSHMMVICRTLFTVMMTLMLGLPLRSDTKADREWRRVTHPIMAKHCTSCHNAADKKAGLDLDIFYYVPSVIRRGETWQKVIKLVETDQMPPEGKPRMSQAEKDSFIYAINKVLDAALMNPDPGPSVLRRLTHREYSYTIKDLLDVDFDAMSYFPKEGGGGEGFDNQSGVLFMTPLMMERYYMAADSIVNALRRDEAGWRKIQPTRYRPTVFRRTWNQVMSWLGRDSVRWQKPSSVAQEIIVPFATRTFRGFLTAEDKSELLRFFDELYFKGLWKKRDGFDLAMQIVVKRILVSPMFLYRTEINLPTHEPYAISNLELATRLSYLLWSSMPDQQLLQTAYQEDLHHPDVLRRETLRMMSDHKFQRFSATFAPQWLGVEEALTTPQVDPELYPHFTESVAQSMHREVVKFFHHVFTSRKNLLELIGGDYTFLNEVLAEHYGVPGISGQDFRPVKVSDYGRGGILGMGAILTATSLPNRTSPVLRGQWVLEQVLGTPAPPPPPDVPELDESGDDASQALDLREILEKHRASPNCAGCHQKMDPIGFAMENFNAVGQWRQYYRGEISIDTRTVMENGKVIQGPSDLKEALSEEKEKFAENFARKMMSYALGRGITFTDSPTLKHMKRSLLDNDFDSEGMMIALVNSYPFRHRRSDMTELYIKK